MSALFRVIFLKLNSRDSEFFDVLYIYNAKIIINFITKKLQTNVDEHFFKIQILLNMFSHFNDLIMDEFNLT